MVSNRAQGAIEYLLLLSAAIIVVAIVISFLPSIINPATGSGSKSTYDYLCKTIIPSGADKTGLTQDCKCYLADPTTQVSYNSAPFNALKDVDSTICCHKSDALLKANWGCS